MFGAAERQCNELRIAVAGLEQLLDVEHGHGAVAAMDAVGGDLMRSTEVTSNSGHARGEGLLPNTMRAAVAGRQAPFTSQPEAGVPLHGGWRFTGAN
jgi:hypothetical protein